MTLRFLRFFSHAEDQILPVNFDNTTLFQSFRRGFIITHDTACALPNRIRKERPGTEVEHIVTGDNKHIIVQSESIFDSPAYTFRLGYEGLTNFKMSAGVYYCANTAENMTLKKDYKEFCTNNYNGQKKVPLTIWYAEAQYMNDYVTLRGTYMQGNMGNSGYLSNYFNNLLQNDTDEELQYDEGVVGRGVVSVMGEVGLNLKNCFYADTKGPELYPFVHYEHYDSQAKAADMAGVVRDSRGKVDMWSFGVNWKPINEVAVKCNYTTRKIGDGDMNSANELNLAVAYNFQLF